MTVQFICSTAVAASVVRAACVVAPRSACSILPEISAEMLVMAVTTCSRCFAALNMPSLRALRASSVRRSASATASSAFAALCSASRVFSSEIASDFFTLAVIPTCSAPEP